MNEGRLGKGIVASLVSVALIIILVIVFLSIYH